MKNLKLNKIFSLHILLTFILVGINYSQISAIKQDLVPIVYLEPQYIDDFTRKLNKLGRSGYQLKLIERYAFFAPPENPLELKIAGILQLNPNDTFEYEWITGETLAEISVQLNNLGRKGFHFNNRVDYSVFEDVELPEVTAKDGTFEKDLQSIDRSIATIKKLMSTEPVDGNLFILERKNKSTEPIEFKIATAIPSTSIFGSNVIDTKKITPTLESSIKEINSNEFYPVTNFFSSKIFDTRVSHLPSVLFQSRLRAIENVENYKVVEVFNFFKHFKRNMELATKEGGSIQVATNNFAIVKQTPNRKVSYDWLEPNKKDFLKSLNKSSSNGGRYLIDQIDNS